MLGWYIKKALKTATTNTQEIRTIVKSLLSDIEAGGEATVHELARKFDNWEGDFILSEEKKQKLIATVPESVKEDIRFAHAQVSGFAKAQRQSITEFEHETLPGVRLGQKIIPMDVAGCYVPGGRFAHACSAIMSVATAKAAGVKTIIACSPPRGDSIAPAVVYALEVAGADIIIEMGGVQAIATMAFGLFTGKPTNILAGPGNAYVAEAKRQVYGVVGIDMIAGPSEVLIITDGDVNPDWLALDMFAQAEHDEMAQSLLLCPDASFLDRVAQSIDRLLPNMKRRDIIAKSLRDRGALIEISDFAEGIDLANQIAPEHLQLAVKHPDQLVGSVRHAGAIFMGVHTPESLGDYCAGPNHVLPTSSTARFASPLGVYDFQKRTSLINCSAEGAARLANIAGELAFSEGLEAHALSALARRPEAD